MSHVGVVVAPLAGLEFIQRPLRLLHSAGLPVQQPDGLRADQHQPGRAITVDHIHQRRDERTSIPADQGAAGRKLQCEPLIQGAVYGQEPGQSPRPLARRQREDIVFHPLAQLR